jgi:hypothetical protein
MSHRLIIRSSQCALLAGLLSACAHTRTTRFDTSSRPERRTPSESIRLYGAQRPTCPYDEVGRVTAESRLFVSWGRVVSAARKDSARISGATVTPEGGVAVGETSSLSGIVIRFKSVDCMK